VGREDDETREATESAALRGGCEGEEDREVNESAALSGGREGDEDREAALCEGREPREDASESANLYVRRGTRADFRAVEEADESESPGLRGARIPCAESLLGLVVVMGECVTVKNLL
jgi:hypothetical protein